MIKLINKIGVIIFFIVAFVGIFPIFLARDWMMDKYEKSLYEERYVEVKNQCNLIRNTLVTSEFFTVQQNSKEISNAIAQVAFMQNGRIMLINSEFIVVEDTYNVDKNKHIVYKEVINALNGKPSIKNEGVLEYILPVYGVDYKNVNGVILATFDNHNIEELVADMRKQSLIMAIVISVIVTSLAVTFSALISRPHERLDKAIKKAAKGQSFDGIDSDCYSFTELDNIAKNFNANAARMRTVDENRQLFVSNVAHELKTPITSIKVLADSLLMQGDMPTEIYKEFLTDIGGEIDRESEIINDLLSLVRLENNKADLNITRSNLNDMMELILKRLRPMAAGNNIELVFESFRPVMADIDEVKLTMAIQNLVENAIKYNRLDGWVRVSLNADHKHFFIKVADSGIGIPSKDLLQIFDRFYRVDKARSRATGGTGLGLAITKTIIESHHGEIRVFSKEEEGTTFNVRIPLNYKKEQNVDEDNE